MKYHHHLLDDPFFRIGSPAWIDMVNSVRENHSLFDLNENDWFLINETEAGKTIVKDNKIYSLDVPFKTPDHPKKKFAVYTKNDKDNIVLVRFGDPNLSIKNCDPIRAKSFLQRMRCSNPGPKWKARWWSCNIARFWRALDLECATPW